MITIGFCNLKGGVGKTTACQNIAVALAKAGYKIAVIDMDPQSNLSAGFGVTPSETDPQVFDLLSGGASWDDIVCSKEGVDIIPSSLNLVMAELNHTGPVSKDTVLRDALSKIDQDRYDYILLDSPPQLGIFTRNVLAASSKIIVPMDGGFYSLFGLRLLNGAMTVFRERLNPELEISGILMTNYNPRLYIARQVFDEVNRTFGPVVFRNCIRQNVSLIEASSMGESIFAYSPKSKGAECYRDVARELLEKINMKHEDFVPPEPVIDVIESIPEPEPKAEDDEPAFIDEVKVIHEEVVPPETVIENVTEPEPEILSKDDEPAFVDEVKAEPEEITPPEPVIESKPAPKPEHKTNDKEEARELLDKLKLKYGDSESPAQVIESKTEAEQTAETFSDSDSDSDLEVLFDITEQNTETTADEAAAIAEEPKAEPVYISHTLGEYEEGIKQSVLEMLPEKFQPMWKQILGSVSSITRDEIDARTLRDDFEACDKDRYKFYVLNDERPTFWPASYPDQIIDPMRCVMKFDEYDGSAEVYI